MSSPRRHRSDLRVLCAFASLSCAIVACASDGAADAPQSGGTTGAANPQGAGAGSGASAITGGMGGVAGSGIAGAIAGAGGASGQAGSAGQADSAGASATGGTGMSGAGGSGAQGASGGSAGAQDLPDAGGSPAFHVFLLLGQSNMAGYPKAQSADAVEDPRIQVLGYDDCASTGRIEDEWDVAAPPLHECWNGAIGPGDWFAKTLLESLPSNDTIGLVPCAISGERIETFLKDGGSKYDWIVDRARLAQDAGGVIEGILFHQGESNNGDPSWPGKVRTLVEDLRADLGLGDVPFLAGELAYDGGCAGHNTQVNMLPAVIERAYVVSASGLALDPADTAWNLHFGHDAQVTFGQRYAQAMIDALAL